MNRWTQKPPLGTQLDYSHPLTKGLVGCWLMNEGSGNRIHDISGNGNNGTLINGPVWKPGRDGASISFDGNNDYVNCGNSINPISAFTIMMQLSTADFPQGGGNIRGALCKGTDGTAESIFFSLNYGVFSWKVRIGSVTYSISFPKFNQLNKFYHVVGTYTGAKVQGYQDGILVNEGAASGYAGSTLPVYIGTMFTSIYRWSGLISDARIYNRALSAQEVGSLYENPYACFQKPAKRYYFLPPEKPVTKPVRFISRKVSSPSAMKPPLGSQLDPQHPLSQGLALRYLMNETSGNRVHDITGNRNHGTLINGPVWVPGRNGSEISFDGIDDKFVIKFAWPKVTGSLIMTIYPLSGASDQSQNPFLNVSDNGVYGAYITPVQNRFPGIYNGGWRNFANRPSIASVVNTRQCIAYIWYGSTSLLYINGVYRSSEGYTSSYLPTGNITIGADEVSNRFSNILVSDVAIWNRALSPAEVQDLYINPYACIWSPQKYFLMPQGVTIPPHILHRRAA